MGDKIRAGTKPPSDETATLLPEACPIEWLERAAIKEFCGNMSRSRAEQETLDEIRNAEREAREEMRKRATPKA